MRSSFHDWVKWAGERRMGGGHYEYGNGRFGSKQDEHLLRNVQAEYSYFKNDFSVLNL
jgi:hypothetical protein